MDNKIILYLIAAYALYRIFLSKEGFALSSGIILDKNSLDNDKTYVIGSIKPESQVKTTTPAINGGKDCLSFPNTVYKLAEIKDAVCSVQNGVTADGIASANNDSNYNLPAEGQKGYIIKYGPGTCVSDADIGSDGNGTCRVTNDINNTLKSPNGAFKLVLQNDAHLILYDGNNNIAWKTGVYNPPNSVGPYRLVLQPNDGNLVEYDSKGVSRAVWATNKFADRTRGPFRLSVQDDGNIVVYDRNNGVVWARS
jgi:hypothetical protein